MDTAKEPIVTIQQERVKVKRRIGLAGGISFVMGGVIGSGIFISPKGALLHSGSIGLSLLIWALCGGIAMVFGLVFGELARMVPRSGGDYTYIRQAFGGAPAFLVSWITTVIMTPGSRAILSLVFADYVCAPIFRDCGPPNLIRKLIACAQLTILAITNILSVRFSTSVQIVFTVAKVLALVLISAGGFLYLFKGEVQNFENSFEGSNWNVESISLAIYSCTWAYSGFTYLNDFAEEIINAKRNISLSIIISLIVITAIYMTANISYFTVISKEEFISAPAVASLWGDKVLTSAAIIIPISVMLSVHGAANGGFFSDSRQRFAAAREGHLPEVVSYLHPESRIPVLSVLLNTMLAMLYLIPADIDELINMTGFVGFTMQGASVTSLLIFWHRRRNQHRNTKEFSIPIVIPVISLLVCIFMVIAPFVTTPRVEFLYGIALVLAGLLFYFPFVYFKLRVPGFDHVTTFLQLFLNIAPTRLEYDDEK